MDQSKEFEAQPATFGKSMQEFEKEKPQQVIFGLSENVHIHAMWEVRHMQAQTPEKFMNVRSVKMSDEDIVTRLRKIRPQFFF